MEKFKITVYENSLLDKTILTKFNPIIVRKAHDDELTQENWGNLVEIVVSSSDLNLILLIVNIVLFMSQIIPNQISKIRP